MNHHPVTIWNLRNRWLELQAEGPVFAPMFRIVETARGWLILVAFDGQDHVVTDKEGQVKHWPMDEVMENIIFVTGGAIFDLRVMPRQPTEPLNHTGGARSPLGGWGAAPVSDQRSVRKMRPARSSALSHDDLGRIWHDSCFALFGAVKSDLSAFRWSSRALASLTSGFRFEPTARHNKVSPLCPSSLPGQFRRHL